MWARCMCSRASPVAAPPPRATSPRLQGITFAAAMALSGELVEKFASLAYLAMAAIAAAGFVIALGGRRKWHAEALRA